AWYAAKTEFLGPRLPHWVSGAVVFAAAVAIPVLATQGVLFAEPLFSGLLAVAVIEAERSTQPWVAGVAAALALLTRSIGIAIVTGILGFLLLHRAPRRVALAVVLPGVVAAIAWGLWVLTHARQIDPALALNYGTYLAPVSQAGLSAVAVNIRDLPRPLEVLAFGWIPVFWLYFILAMTARAISANFAELLPVVQNLPDSAVLATDDEALVWLYSRRLSVPLSLESYRGRELIRPTPAEHRAYLERMGVTHVLLASATSPSAIELRALIGAYPSLLTAIYRWPDGRWLFAVNRGQ